MKGHQTRRHGVGLVGKMIQKKEQQGKGLEARPLLVGSGVVLRPFNIPRNRVVRRGSRRSRRSRSQQLTVS
jgi:hypothetical protein